MELRDIIEKTYGSIEFAAEELELPIKFVEGIADGSIGIYIAPLASIEKLVIDSKYIELEDIIKAKEEATNKDRELLESMLAKYNTSENENRYRCSKLEYYSNLLSLRDVTKTIVEVERELEIREKIEKFNVKYNL